MRPKKFNEANVTFAKDQAEYEPLDAYYAKKSPTGDVVTCWNLSFFERLRVLFLGEIWLHTLTFHSGFKPVFLTTKKSDVIQTVEN